MPNRPIFALLIAIPPSFPVALLAQEVVQTQTFNYPLVDGGKFTIVGVTLEANLASDLII